MKGPGDRMTTEFVIYLLMTVVLLPVTGGLLAITPWLMRRNEVFAVTVPAAAQDEPVVRRLKREYTLAMVAFTAAFTVLVILLYQQGSPERATIWLVVACLVLPVVSFVLMLQGRSKVERLKVERGWHAERSRRAAVVAEGDIPQAVSLGWELLNVPIVLLTLAIAVVGYPSAPDLIPMHANLVGEVTSYAPKSWATVLMPVAVEVFMAATMAFSHWSITRSKRVSDEDAPVSSAYAYGLFARAQSIFIVAMGVALDLSFIAMQFSMLGWITLGQAVIPICIVALAAVLGSVALSVVYGQAGSRIVARVGDPNLMPADDDKHWKLGVFYVNGDDASLFVPDRFGVGWTSNFGRPASWAIIAGFVALTIGFIVLIMAMAGGAA